ncbi:hypothetical protein HK102_003340, partial [Quaeritorhiza haematococci]
MCPVPMETSPKGAPPLPDLPAPSPGAVANPCTAKQLVSMLQGERYLRVLLIDVCEFAHFSIPGARRFAFFQTLRRQIDAELAVHRAWDEVRRNSMKDAVVDADGVASEGEADEVEKNGSSDEIPNGNGHESNGNTQMDADGDSSETSFTNPLDVNGDTPSNTTTTSTDPPSPDTDKLSDVLTPFDLVNIQDSHFNRRRNADVVIFDESGSPDGFAAQLARVLGREGMARSVWWLEGGMLGFAEKYPTLTSPEQGVLRGLSNGEDDDEDDDEEEEKEHAVSSGNGNDEAEKQSEEGTVNGENGNGHINGDTMDDDENDEKYGTGIDLSEGSLRDYGLRDDESNGNSDDSTDDKHMLEGEQEDENEALCAAIESATSVAINAKSDFASSNNDMDTSTITTSVPSENAANTTAVSTRDTALASILHTLFYFDEKTHPDPITALREKQSHLVEAVWYGKVDPVGDIPLLILPPFLFLGSCFAARLECIRACKIKHIVRLGWGFVNHASEDDDVVYYDFPIEDSPKEPIRGLFQRTSEIIETARLAGENVLVHCHAGVSRSATIVLAYLMKYHQMSLYDAWNKTYK